MPCSVTTVKGLRGCTVQAPVHQTRRLLGPELRDRGADAVPSEVFPHLPSRGAAVAHDRPGPQLGTPAARPPHDALAHVASCRSRQRPWRGLLGQLPADQVQLLAGLGRDRGPGLPLVPPHDPHPPRPAPRLQPLQPECEPQSACSCRSRLARVGRGGRALGEAAQHHQQLAGSSSLGHRVARPHHSTSRSRCSLRARAPSRRASRRRWPSRLNAPAPPLPAPPGAARARWSRSAAAAPPAGWSAPPPRRA